MQLHIHLNEIVPLVYWLYAEETELFVSNGDTIISSEGVHQGCGFSNILFTLLMRYVLRHLPKVGVSAKGAYLDDAFSKSTPAAALKVVEAIKTLETETHLKANLSKFHLHAPNEDIAQECRKIFAKVDGIKIHSNMNLTFLRTSIGTMTSLKQN